jgi:sialic acid synthase SpsE
MKLNNGRSINQSTTPYVIAEFNTSHFGDLSLAKEMIIKAHAIGVDCVKFQSWTTDSLYSLDYYEENKMARRFVEKFSLNQVEMIELSHFSRQLGIDFASTPYNDNEVDYLIEKCEVPFIKVASMDINNLEFLKHIANTKSAVVLSTGMSTYDEIARAVRVFEEAGSLNLTILHCTSVYPSPHSIINLNNVKRLQEMFPKYQVGYSDHTLGNEVPIASVAMGCSVIEKHFTLDSTKIGMDNQMATEVKDFEKLIVSLKKVHESLGSYDRCLSEAELSMKNTMRRSLVARVDITEGEVITADMLTAKRPPNGISPDQVFDVVGKIAKRSIQIDRTLHAEDIK